MESRIEKYMKTYPEIKKELNILEYQLSHFVGVSEQEVMETMVFGHLQGDSIKSSRISDNTAKAACLYREKTKRLNEEYYHSLLSQHRKLCEEISFFEFCISQLEGELSNIMSDLVINRLSWMELTNKYHVSQTMISKYRKKAVTELKVMYEIRDQQLETYLLS